jgi:hypothetical protein
LDELPLDELPLDELALDELLFEPPPPEPPLCERLFEPLLDWLLDGRLLDCLALVDRLLDEVDGRAADGFPDEEPDALLVDRLLDEELDPLLVDRLLDEVDGRAADGLLEPRVLPVVPGLRVCSEDLVWLEDVDGSVFFAEFWEGAKFCDRAGFCAVFGSPDPPGVPDAPFVRDAPFVPDASDARWRPPGFASSAVIGGVRLLSAGPADVWRLPADDGSDPVLFAAPDRVWVGDWTADPVGVLTAGGAWRARISPSVWGELSTAAGGAARPGAPVGRGLGTTPRLCADSGSPRPAAQESGLGYAAGDSASGRSSPFWAEPGWAAPFWSSGGAMLGLPNMMVAPASEPTARATPVEVIGRRFGSDILVNVRSAWGSTPSRGTISRATFLRLGMTYGEADRCAGTAGNGWVWASSNRSSKRGSPLRPSRSPRVIAVKADSRLSWVSS